MVLIFNFTMEYKMNEKQDKNTEIASTFKPGDWIIATRPMMVPNHSGFSFGFNFRMIPDTTYMYKPIKLSAVTEHHVVFEFKSCTGNVSKKIIPMHEIRDRRFVIADQVLIDATCSDYDKHE